MQKFKSLIFYTLKSIKFIWVNSKSYLILILFSTILGVIQVFPAMYLASSSIDLLIKQVPFSDYIRVVLTILLIMLSVNVVSMLINHSLDYAKKRFYTKIKLDIDNICLEAEYADIQSKRFIENKNFAIAAMENGSLDLCIQSIKKLLSSAFIMAGVLYIISEVSFLILIPLAVSLFLNFYCDYLNARQNFIDIKEAVEYGKKSSYLQSISTDFAYAKEIRMFNLKERFQGRMDEVEQLLYRSRELRRKQRKPSGILVYSSETILEIAIYLYFGYKVLVAASITLGQFSLYANALRQLKNSVNDIIYTITEFIVNTEYLDGLFGFLDLKRDTSVLNGEAAPISQAQIRFENVSFRYPFSNCDTLKNINITINEGETLLIVGENGAGKSTFVKLLCGLYRPTSGKIYLNGTDISTMDQVQYREQISAVFQDFKLFAMSIAENICAMKEKDAKKLASALEQVDMQKQVNAAAGADTALYRIFDENGVEFSGGEMQRLAIARAIYKDAPVLVLDEPTSALDPKAEYEIYNNFQKMAQDRTAIYISHRLSGIKFSDKIAVFHSGEIAEYGTHESLMEAQGLYAELYQLQSGLYQHEKEAAQ